MSNRFQNIGFQPRNIEFFPEVQQDILPDISGLGNYMRSLDAQLDQDLELPQYIQQSESDKNAYLGFKQESQKFRDNAIEAFKSGKNDVGNEYLRQYKNFLKKAKQPDGTYSRLEQGKAQYNAQLKRLQDTYLKGENANPLLFNYAKRKLDEGINPFEDEFGSPRADIGYPNLVSDKPRRDFTKNANEILDNIEAEQIAYSGAIGKIKGMSLQRLISEGKIKFVDPAKVVGVLIDYINGNQGIRESFAQYGEALGVKGQGNILNKDLLNSKEFQKKYQKNPNVILEAFDTSSALGAATKALVKSKLFKQEDKSSKIFTDQEALKTFEMNFGKAQHRSPLFTKGTGMAELKIDDSGKLIKEGSYFINPKTGSVGQHKSKREQFDIREYILTKEGQEAHPALPPIVEKFDKPVGMGIEEYNKLIGKKYEELQESLKSRDVIYTDYNSEQGKNVIKGLMGTSKEGLGQIVHKNMIMYKANGEPVTIKVKDFLKQNKISPSEFKERFNVLGHQRSDGIIPSGHIANYVAEDGTQQDFIISDISIQDAQSKKPFWQLSQAAHNGSIEKTGWVDTGLPGQFGLIKAEAENIYESDLLYRQLANNLAGDNREEIENRIKELEKNPEKDRFIKRDVNLYIPNPDNPDDEYGIPLDISLERIIQLAEKSIINGRK